MDQQETRYSKISNDRLQRSEKQKLYMQLSMHCVNWCFLTQQKGLKQNKQRPWDF